MRVVEHSSQVDGCLQHWPGGQAPVVRASAHFLLPQGTLASRQAVMLQGLSDLEAQERKVLAATSALHQVLLHLS